jgi:hypothetical protein
VDLYQRVSDAYRTGGIDIESNEDKRTVVMSSILPDIYALHCSHIRHLAISPELPTNRPATSQCWICPNYKSVEVYETNTRVYPYERKTASQSYT